MHVWHLIRPCVERSLSIGGGEGGGETGGHDIEEEDSGDPLV